MTAEKCPESYTPYLSDVAHCKLNDNRVCELECGNECEVEMEDKVMKEVCQLPAILKAHIYEPNLEEAVDVAYKAGMKKVVEYLQKHLLNVEELGIDGKWIPTEKWKAKLKEWGIDAER